MKEEKKKKIHSTLISKGSELAGATLGTLIAGPLGAVGGAVVGTTVEKAFEWVSEEIRTKILTKSEKRKIESVFDYCIREINERLSEGKKLRTDDFFDQSINERSTAEELFEGVIFSAQRESEERKLPFLAKFYANLCFREDISREVANSILKLINDCTYRDFVILKCVAICQQNEHIHKKIAYTEVKGLDNISIATDTYTLYRKGIIYSKSANIILSPGGINPTDLMVNGVGAFLYMLMELENVPFDDLFNRTFQFFSDTHIE